MTPLPYHEKIKAENKIRKTLRNNVFTGNIQDYWRRKRRIRFLLRTLRRRGHSNFRREIPKAYRAKLLTALQHKTRSKEKTPITFKKRSDFLPFHKREWKKSLPQINAEQLSFIDNPNAAFEVLRKIDCAFDTEKEIDLNFADEGCVDIAPYLVLSLMTRQGLPIFSRGSIKPAITGMIEAVGLSDLLEIRDIRKKAPSPLFVPFRIRTGDIEKQSEPNSGETGSRKEKIIDDLTKAITEWVASLERKCPNDLKRNVARIVGEVLDNAERHGGGSWAIAGFMAPTENLSNQLKNLTFLCSIAMISTGEKNISESIQNAEDKETREGLKKYIQQHEKSEISKEALALIYAFQDGVSCVSQKAGKSRGGTGLMDVIAFCGSLAEIDSQFNSSLMIISGKTAIKIPPEWCKKIHKHMNNPETESSSRRLWMNEENSRDKPPEKRYIYELQNAEMKNPLVTIRFSVGTLPHPQKQENQK